MYVCICNAFTDRHVKEHVKDGAKTPACVFRARGCAPQCGKCIPTLREIVDEHLNAVPIGGLMAAE